MTIIWMGLAILVAVLLAGLLGRRREEVVYDWENALLYRDGKFAKVLQPGRYVFWFGPKRRLVTRVTKADQVLQAAPVDVTSADKFVFRAGCHLVYRVVDVRWAAENSYAYRVSSDAAQAVASLISRHALKDALEERAALNEELRAMLAAELPQLEFLNVALGPITLPPELRRMFTDVERAKMEGLAALERARAEHASLRSLANAARLLKDNPELMRLRLLQSVSPTGKGATLVLGQDALAMHSTGMAHEDAPAAGQ